MTMPPRRRTPFVPALLAMLSGVYACATDSVEDDGEPIGSLSQSFTETDSEPNDNAGSSQALKVVDLVTGTLTGAEGDWYLTSGRATQEVYAYVDGFANPSLNLFTSNNPLIPFVTDLDSGPGNRPVIAGAVLPIMTNEFMYIEIENESAQTGAYTMHSYVANADDYQDEMEPNDTIGSAEPMVMPKIRGTINGLGEQDWFTFSAEMGQSIAAIVNNDRLNDGLLRSHVYLRNNIGNMVALGSNTVSDSGGGATAIAATAPYSGTFAVQIQSAAPNVAGEYEIVVLVDGRPVVVTTQEESASSGSTTTADALRSQHVGLGSLGVGETDFWRVVGGPGDVLYAYVTGDSESVALRMRDLAGAQIEADFYSGPSGGAVIAGRPTQEKMTFLEVEEIGQNAAIDDYELYYASFAPGDIDDHGNPFAPTIANAVPLTQARNRANLVFNETDYFAFDAIEGETLVVIVDENTDAAGTALDLTIELRDAADSTLAVGYNGTAGPGAFEDNAVGPITVPSTGTYYLRVANDDTTTTAIDEYEFVVLRSYGAVVCGDGDVDGQETCDDGNIADGDGCSSLCETESGYLCANEPSACNEICGDGLIVGAETCDQLGSPPQGGDGCSALCLIETGWTCMGAPSNCSTVCGDGIVTGSEACDDANTAGGDGCNATCTATEAGFSCLPTQPTQCNPICGDGVVVAGEVCDDGNTTAGDGCLSNCLLVEGGWTCPSGGGACSEICGDGLVVGGEVCDDSNTNANDGCDATCASVEAGWSCPANGGACTPICGDGTTVGGEACDDGNTVANDGCDCGVVESGYACPSGGGACAPICGDNLAVGSEACDDGNTAAGDGCAADCATVEAGWTCPAPPMAGACSEICGDGLIVGIEGCDDGNVAPGDGCNASCGVETGFSCMGEPSVCTPGCGDGIVTGAEACDDGNTDDGDGCSGTCDVESGYACAGDPSVCDAVCGDGLIVGDEGCDDGNDASGDGCDASCLEEEGYTCTGEPSQCVEDGGAGGGGAGTGGNPATGGGDPGTGGAGAAGGSSGSGQSPSPSADGGCSVSADQPTSSGGVGAWSLLLGLGVALRRRRQGRGRSTLAS